MNRILLYGATGYTGQLIAAEASRQIAREEWNGQLVLASREPKLLRQVAERYKLPWVAFGLDDREPVVRVLQGFDVVLNAAGLFLRTASRLAKASLDRGCHYVDLNRDIDVDASLDDLAALAWLRGLTIVSGAGWTTVAADVLLDHALEKLADSQPKGAVPLTTLRLGFSIPPVLSRGAALTLTRAVREQVTVVRSGRLSHVPVGQLERGFEFALKPGQRVSRITSAVDALDTVVLNRTAQRHGYKTLDVESYLDLSGPQRAAYQLASFGAIGAYLPFVRRAFMRQLSLLPEGPDVEERSNKRPTVALTIEDAWRREVANLTLQTPNLYDFSVLSALEVATRLARVPPSPENANRGWMTPSSILRPNPLSQPGSFTGLFARSILFDRLTGDIVGSDVG